MRWQTIKCHEIFIFIPESHKIQRTKIPNMCGMRISNNKIPMFNSHKLIIMKWWISFAIWKTPYNNNNEKNIQLQMGNILRVKQLIAMDLVCINILCSDCYISHLLDLFSTKQFKRRISHRFWIDLLWIRLLMKLNFSKYQIWCAEDVNLVHWTLNRTTISGMAIHYSQSAEQI